MRTIYKYQILPPVQILPLTEGAKVVSVGSQSGMLCVWVELDPAAKAVNCAFVPVPTGGEVPEGGTYVGTAQSLDGWMVFHLYQMQDGPVG